MKEAISGMLHGLDPHSAFLDEESLKSLQEGTMGEFEEDSVSKLPLIRRVLR